MSAGDEPPATIADPPTPGAAAAGMRLPRLRICLSIALPNPTGKRGGPLPHSASIMRPVSRRQVADRFPHRRVPLVKRGSRERAA